MPKLFVNGLSLHYQHLPGNSTGLVLVHGLAASLAFWYFRILPLLSREITLTLYDLRGHGQSDMPSSGYTTAHMAADLHGLLDQLHTGPAHLVGHSFGGAVALHYAVLHPERVASLTLADSRIWSLQPPASRRYFSTGESRGGSGEPFGDQFLDALTQPELPAAPCENAGGASHPPVLFAGRESQPSRRWLQLLRTTTAREDITAIAGLTADKIRRVIQPVLLIFGEHSHCLPSCRRMAEQLPRAKVVISPGAGHFHPATRPAVFVRELMSFLREVTP